MKIEKNSFFSSCGGGARWQVLWSLWAWAYIHMVGLYGHGIWVHGCMKTEVRLIQGMNSYAWVHWVGTTRVQNKTK